MAAAQRPRRSLMTADSDGICTWVHKDEGCVGRFGKMAYEVHDGSSPPRLVDFGRDVGEEGWTRFVDLVRSIHDFQIPSHAVPNRFHGLCGVETEEPLFLIPLKRLEDSHSPFDIPVWGRGEVTPEDVQAALDAGDLVSEYVDMGIRHLMPPGWDARRIAYLVANPSDHPLFIEVDDIGMVSLEDGFHRLAAAIFRRDEGIVAILGGYVDRWPEAFPGLVPLNDAARNSLQEDLPSPVAMG